MKVFYPQDPRSDMEMSDAEKARRARNFRRWALVTDVCTVLLVVSGLTLGLLYRSSLRTPLALTALLAVVFLLSLAGILAGTVLAFRRCPFCGRYFRGWDWTVGPFKWRLFHCPDCDFTPYWDQEHQEETKR